MGRELEAIDGNKIALSTDTDRVGPASDVEPLRLCVRCTRRESNRCGTILIDVR